MPYARRQCACGAQYVPRARNDEACGRCRRATPRRPAPLQTITSPSRILFFDFESAGVNALKADLGFAVVFGYKFADEDEPHSITIRKGDLKKFDDRWLLTQASRVFEASDLVVGHFASVFDRRFFQGRLAINDLPSIPPTKMRDTCMIARSAFNFSSNRLKHLSQVLNLSEQKQEKRAGHDWPGWWFGVMQGNMKALKDMAAYCRQDVLTVEALYHRLLPFDNAHPRIIEDRSRCGACGGKVGYRGFTWANGNRYRRYVCLGCGRWGREMTKVRT
jgi:hypothetical protein